MDILEQEFIGASIIEFENKLQYQSYIIIRCCNGEEYELAISNAHKFTILKIKNKFSDRAIHYD